MNREEIIHEMNLRGERHLPFLFIIDYSMKNCQLFSPDEAAQQGVLFNFNGFKNYGNEKNDIRVEIIDKKPIDFSRYLLAFNYIQQQILLGNSYLVNLTFPTQVTVSGSLDDIFLVSEAKYKLLYKNEFVVFSPEIFVKIRGNKVSTYPMKGTIDATRTNALETILHNKKEMAEHATVVDLLRNDLSRIATNVKVEKYRYIDEIHSGEKLLYQVSSEITGELPDDFHQKLGNIIFEMLPAGSVTGAPKRKTLEIIANAENYDRGFYTGIVGYYDGKDLDSCVLIRFIENCNGQLIYKSGGGITSESIVEDEYKELIDKIYVPIG